MGLSGLEHGSEGLTMLQLCSLVMIPRSYFGADMEFVFPVSFIEII